MIVPNNAYVADEGDTEPQSLRPERDKFSNMLLCDAHVQFPDLRVEIG
jgi:hypothetical protein